MENFVDIVSGCSLTARDSGERETTGLTHYTRSLLPFAFAHLEATEREEGEWSVRAYLLQVGESPLRLLFAHLFHCPPDVYFASK